MEEDLKHTHRGEADVKTEAEMRVMQPQAKELQQHQRLEEAGNGGLPYCLWRAYGNGDTLLVDFWPLELVRK